RVCIPADGRPQAAIDDANGARRSKPHLRQVCQGRRATHLAKVWLTTSGAVGIINRGTPSPSVPRPPGYTTSHSIIDGIRPLHGWPRMMYRPKLPPTASAIAWRQCSPIIPGSWAAASPGPRKPWAPCSKALSATQHRQHRITTAFQNDSRKTPVNRRQKRKATRPPHLGRPRHYWRKGWDLNPRYHEGTHALQASTKA